MEKIKVILIGAGSRGMCYSEHMKSHKGFEIVAVAEPIDSRREYIKKMYKIPEENCFKDWKPLLEMGKIADLAVIATMDRDHFEPSMTAISLGYDLLLEKPICPTAKECIELTKAAEKNNTKVVICTVLRYTDIFIAIKDIIDSGKLGEIMSVNHEESVGNIHQSHSFVRGNWGNEKRSSPMLLQKSCHDIDILQWLLSKKCKEVQSFGELSYFKKENAPEGAADYCIDGCPHAETCPYNAVKLYLNDKENLWFRGAATGDVNPTDEQVENVLRTTQYGKCVFKCDNDVVDHQTVNMLFEDDISVTFTMNAFNKGGRSIHIMGTKGELTAALDDSTPIKIYPIHCSPTEACTPDVINLKANNSITAGHGGGDIGIVFALYDYLKGKYVGKSIPTIKESLYNHLVTFAAEESRLTNSIVDVEKFISELE